MTVNNLITDAVKEFERPVFPNTYDKKKVYGSEIAFIENVDKGYFVFNYISENAVLYGDNKELEEKTTLQLHYYTRSSILDMVKPLKKALMKHGFIINFIRRAHENDTGYNHLTADISIYSCDMED